MANVTLSLASMLIGSPPPMWGDLAIPGSGSRGYSINTRRPKEVKKISNCVNCGAAFKLHRENCDYCGTIK
jgi:hypothetical protein